GHRIQGGPAGRRMRSAAPTLDPAATHLVLAPPRTTVGSGRLGPVGSASCVYTMIVYTSGHVIATQSRKGVHAHEHLGPERPGGGSAPSRHSHLGGLPICPARGGEQRMGG